MVAGLWSLTQEAGLQFIENTGLLKFKGPTHHGSYRAQFSLAVFATSLARFLVPVLSGVKIIVIRNC